MLLFTSVMFFNRKKDNLAVYPHDRKVSVSPTDLLRVISIVFSAFWSLIDEDLEDDSSVVKTELIMRFNGIEKKLYPKISTHIACRNDKAKQYINGMSMLENILKKYGFSFD